MEETLDIRTLIENKLFENNKSLKVVDYLEKIWDLYHKDQSPG